MIPTFVISLKDEQQRRDYSAAHLRQRGFEFEFFDAIDARKMNVLSHPDYDHARRRRSHGRDLKPGELGCFLSHRAVYQKIITDNLPFALVVEDDCIFHENAKDVLEAFLAKNLEFDVIRLLGSKKVAEGKHRKILPICQKSGEEFWLIRLRTAYGGTHATLISQAGARKLIKATRKFAYPIDTLMGRCWETGIQAYSIQPGLAVQDEAMDSTIGDARMDKTIELDGFEKWMFKVTRPAFKLDEACGKAQTYWLNAPKDLALKKKFR
tara:strand:+ start:1456 stop:2256 length:801 start_codon:yes stop_codon:yes gene_type:complete